MSTVAPPADPAAPASQPPAALASGRSTPGRYRLASIVIVVVIAVAALVAFLAARSLTEATNQAEQNTGPVLVATQDVFASIAEADAASAAVFLSGQDEDREQRRLYELALERSTAQLEEVSRLVGDDDSAHDAIKAIAADLTTYSGEVEAARLANLAGLDGATERLQRAIAIVQDGIVPEVERITASAQSQLDDDADSGGLLTILALLVLVAAAAALVVAQIWLSRRSRRLLNPPLVAATVLVIVTLAWLLGAWLGQQRDIEAARDDGYDAIALTAEIQTTAFRYKTLESLSLLGAGDVEAQEAAATALAAAPIDDADVDRARDGQGSGTGLLFDATATSDTVRESAAAAEMLVRWQRYRDTSTTIAAQLADDRATAIETAIGPGNADFNGFNTSVESVLSDNRTQFAAGLAKAGDRLRLLRVAAILLPALAVLSSLWGWQLRIAEYR